MAANNQHLQPLMKQIHNQTQGLVIPPEILDELLSRFIMNIPEEERQDSTRVCFQIELAHWFFVDNYCGEEKSDFWKDLGHIKFPHFASLVFQRTPYLQKEVRNVEKIVQDFKEYKMKVPTFGAILMDQELNHVVLVQGFGGQWGFPKGKINKDEDPAACAAREVYEETGYDSLPLLNRNHFIESCCNERWTRLYIIRGVDRNIVLKPHTRYEIKNIGWFQINELPECKKDPSVIVRPGFPHTAFHNVFPYIKRLRRWIEDKLHKKNEIEYFKSHAPNRPDHILDRNWKPNNGRNRKQSESSSNSANSANAPAALDPISAFVMAQSQNPFFATLPSSASTNGPSTTMANTKAPPQQNGQLKLSAPAQNNNNNASPSTKAQVNPVQKNEKGSAGKPVVEASTNAPFIKNINPKRRLFISDEEEPDLNSLLQIKMTKLKITENNTSSNNNKSSQPNKGLSTPKLLPENLILPTPDSWLNFKLNPDEIIKAMSLAPGTQIIIHHQQQQQQQAHVQPQHPPKQQQHRPPLKNHKRTPKRK